MNSVRGSEMRGIAFPIDKGREGYWSRKNSEALRRTSIMMILATRKGERVGEPDFGSRIHEYLFEPNDDILAQTIREEVTDAINRWDPYIRLQAVTVTTSDHQITIYIDYMDASDENQEIRSLAIPLRRM